MADLKKILDYLSKLELNNNREWYHNHKQERLEILQEFENFLQDLIFEIGNFDEIILHINQKDITFKIVRDTRFGADKSPYNPVMRAHISAKGKLPIPVGYFISLQPHDGTMLGGGLFASTFKDATSMIRDYILIHGEELDKIVNHSDFQSRFSLLGAKLKKVPRGYDSEHPYGDYLKYKSMFVEEFIADRELHDYQSFVKLAAKEFQYMKPLNDFLNKALIDFQMPER